MNSSGFGLTPNADISILENENTQKGTNEMAEEKTSSKKAIAKPKAPASGGKTCSVAKCKQPIRAKGYCRKHYMGWRRGEVGDNHRFKTCSKEGCRKKALLGGVCEEHKKGAVVAAS